MRAAKSEASRLRDRTEGFAQEFGSAVKDTWARFRNEHQWWGHGNQHPGDAGSPHPGATYTRAVNASAMPVPMAPQAQAASPWNHAAQAAPPHMPAEAAEAALLAAHSHSDDAVMKCHFAALERHVAMGLSPQAARAAIHHMDEWLVSEAGVAEMARAEELARAVGEQVLHKGETVRLAGLVKNSTVNGKLAVLQMYSAESQRWRVALSDGKVYLLQPKFLQPYELRPAQMLQKLKRSLSPPRQGSQTASPSSGSGSAPEGRSSLGGGSPAAAEPSAGGSSQVASPAGSPASLPAAPAAVEAAWKELEANQVAWKEVQEAREIELLEREEALHKLQERLEEQHRHLSEKRRSDAMAHARNLAELESKVNGAAQDRQFVMDDGSPQGPELIEATSPAAEEEEELGEEPDDLYDMDWSAVAHDRKASSAASDGGEGSPPRPGSQASTGLASDDASRTTGTAAVPPPSPGAGSADATDAPASDPAACDSADAEASKAPVAPEPEPLAPAAVPPPQHRQQSPQVVPTVPPAEAEVLHRKMEEKRRLAELHNGEDLVSMPSAPREKESMPGAHRALAEKLEQRRRDLDNAALAPGADTLAESDPAAVSSEVPPLAEAQAEAADAGAQ